MTLSRFFKTVFLFMMTLCLASYAYSSVEVFSDYNTILKVNSNNTIEVNKTLTLKNVYEVGIVPGQIEFKIGRGTDGSIGNIEVDNIVATDSFGNEIKSTLRNTKDYSIIILDVYYPLLPGFEYTFNLYYSLSYEPGGIFFKSLQIPLRESTIPIQKGNFEVQLPQNYHFTYLSSEGKNATVSGNVANWDIENNLPNSVAFEYSYIPLKMGDLKGSYLFWILVNLGLLGFLVYEVRKEIQKVKAQYEEE